MNPLNTPHVHHATGEGAACSVSTGVMGGGRPAWYSHARRKPRLDDMMFETVLCVFCYYDWAHNIFFGTPTTSLPITHILTRWQSFVVVFLILCTFDGFGELGLAPQRSYEPMWVS